LIWHSTVSQNNNVYIIGGAEVSQGVNVNSVDTVFFGQIDFENEIKTWVTLNKLPQKLHFGRAIIVNDRIYYIGGEFRNGEGEENAVYTNSVYSSKINSDGTIGAWRSETSLPDTRSGFALFDTSGTENGSPINRLIIVGGNISPTKTHTTDILYTNIISDGLLTQWNTLDSFPIGIDNPGYVVSDNKLFIVGGGIPGDVLDTIYFSDIKSDGLPDTWELSNVHLPQKGCCLPASSLSNVIYIDGGHDPHASQMYFSTSYAIYLGNPGPTPSPTPIPTPTPVPTPEPTPAPTVPDIKQGTAPWGSQEYDSAHLWAKNITIGDWG
jgi:hypothetical protein